MPNKYWEVQTWFRPPAPLFNISLSLSLKGEDHAGFRFNLEIFGLMLDVSIYDNRHWNYDENRWYEPGDPEDWGNSAPGVPGEVLAAITDGAQENVVDLLVKIRDSFLHEEDGPNGTTYLGLDSEAEMHHFEELNAMIQILRPEEPRPLQTLSPVAPFDDDLDVPPMPVPPPAR